MPLNCGRPVITSYSIHYTKLYDGDQTPIRLAQYGHSLHFWDLRARKNVQTIDLGANHQMALEVRPAHDPAKEYGFCGVVVDTTNLEGSIWTWWREGGKFHCEKTATIPPEAAAKDDLPPLLQGFEAVPPLVTVV